MSKIAIVIPNWNGVDKLRRHLPNVLEAARFNKVDEVIISDDASTDNSVEVLKNEFPEVKVVVREKNNGFSSNVNFGVSKTDADFIVLLNNDASPTRDFLKILIPHFENKKVFSIGCNTGGVWNKAKFKNGFFWHNQADIDPKHIKEAHQTLWASGGSAVFRRSIWDELGGLDTLFDPFYEEDLDLGYRARKRGYINLWEPNSKVEHYHEKGVIASNFSKSSISKVAQRNQLIFIWKNITSDNMFSEHQKALIKMLFTHPKYWSIFISALIKWPQISSKRQVEISQTKLTDEQVLASLV